MSSDYRKFLPLERKLIPEMAALAPKFKGGSREMKTASRALEALTKLMWDFRECVEKIAAKIAEDRGSDTVQVEDVRAAREGFLEQLRKAKV